MRIAILSTYSLEGSIPTDSEYGDPDESTYSCGSSLRDGFRKLGYEVDMFSLYGGENETGMHRIISAINNGYEPDCVYLMHAGSLRENLGQFWRRSNFKNIPMIAEGGDEWQCFGWNFEHNRFSDLVLTLDNQCVEWYTSKGVNAVWFPVWADERVYFYDDTKKTQAISTTAVPTKIRNDRGFLQLNDMIAKEFGDDFINPMRDRQGMEYIPMMDNGDLFRRSKIVFQFSSASEITRRIVEGGACNALIVADRLPPIRNLHEMFVEDEDIVCYNSAGECLDKLNFYLNNNDERIRIADNMHRKVMDLHAAPARAQQFVDYYNHFFGK